MTARERVTTAFLHKQPDKIPVSIGTTIVDGMSRYAKENYEEYLGKPKSETIVTSRGMQTAAMPEWLLQKTDTEFRPIRVINAFTDNTVYHEDGSFTDGYGVYWKKTETDFVPMKGGLFGNITEEDIKSNPWISAYSPEKFAGLKEECIRIKEQGYVVVADLISFGTFEHALWIRGWDDLLCDLYEDPKLAEALFDRTTQGGVELFDALLTEVGDYVDIICHGDDMGMQDRSIISADLYNKYIKKYHKRLFDFIKSKTKAKIFLHTCGSVFELIPGLIEAGVDILNPIQTSAKNMEPERLKKEFGSDLIFWGGIDTQQMLPNATEQQVRDEIKKLVDVLGKDGGYVLAPSHNIQNYVAPERLELLIECMNEYR